MMTDLVTIEGSGLWRKEGPGRRRLGANRRGRRHQEYEAGRQVVGSGRPRQSGVYIGRGSGAAAAAGEPADREKER